MQSIAEMESVVESLESEIRAISAEQAVLLEKKRVFQRRLSECQEAVVASRAASKSLGRPVVMQPAASVDAEAV